MSLPISDVVDVDIVVSAAAPSAPTFDMGRLLGKASVLPYWDRVREYAGLAEVVVDFASNTEEYKAAEIYFADSVQRPVPEKLQIGRMFSSAQAAVILSGAVSDDVDDYTGITNGGFDITINGTLRQISAINCGSATTMANVATAIQTRLQAALASTTCTWNATLSKFVITSPTTGTGSTIGSFASAPTGGSSPTDESSTFGLTNADGARITQGCAAEDVTAAWTASAIVNPSHYGMALTSAFSAQENKDSMAYAQSNKKHFFFVEGSGNVLSTGDTSNLGYYGNANSYRRSHGDSHAIEPYMHMSAMALYLTQDFDQPNGAITGKFKELPGISTSSLTTAQANAVKGYNLNIYVDRGGFSMLEEGVNCEGTFTDEVIGLDWIEAQLQTEVFTVLATARTKVPQTDEGVQKLVQACQRACQRAVNAGLLAPGKWNGDAVGAIESGDFLPAGFYVYAQPVSEQTTSSREAREAPAITIIACGAGAIHSANIRFNFQR